MTTPELRINYEVRMTNTGVGGFTAGAQSMQREATGGRRMQAQRTESTETTENGGGSERRISDGYEASEAGGDER